MADHAYSTTAPELARRQVLLGLCSLPALGIAPGAAADEIRHGCLPAGWREMVAPAADGLRFAALVNGAPDAELRAALLGVDGRRLAVALESTAEWLQAFAEEAAHAAMRVDALAT